MLSFNTGVRVCVCVGGGLQSSEVRYVLPVFPQPPKLRACSPAPQKQWPVLPSSLKINGLSPQLLTTSGMASLIFVKDHVFLQ